MSRRDFLGFFLVGGILSFFFKKITRSVDPAAETPPEKKAMFWRNLED